MFSREEATDTIIAQKGAKVVKTKVDEDNKLDDDTEKESLFELSGPEQEDSLRTVDYEPAAQDEEVFQLGEDNILEEAGSGDLEIPDVNIRDELGDIKEEKKVSEPTQDISDELVALTPDMESKDEQVVYAKPTADNSVEIPVNIHIPEDKDEIKINLNLQIVIKKK